VQFISSIGVRQQSAGPLEIARRFFKPGEHTPIMFEETKHARNFVPVFIALLVVRPWYRTVLFGRNDTGCPLLGNVGHNGVRIIAFVRQQRIGGFVLYERNRLGAIRGLPCTQQEIQWPPRGVTQAMDLGGKAPAGAA
jgi:hypothetical protein